jgi:hypothetical protein
VLLVSGKKRRARHQRLVVIVISLQPMFAGVVVADQETSRNQELFGLALAEVLAASGAMEVAEPVVAAAALAAMAGTVVMAVLAITLAIAQAVMALLVPAEVEEAGPVEGVITMNFAALFTTIFTMVEALAEALEF